MKTFKYTDPDILQAKIEEYWVICKEGKDYQVITKKGDVVSVNKEIPRTIPGLAYHLGFKSRQSMWDYEHEHNNKTIAYIITRARLAIETDNVEKGLTGQYESKTNNLNLAANYGYSQKTIIETTFRDESVDPESLAMVRAMALQLARGQQPKQIEQGKDDSDPD